MSFRLKLLVAVAVIVASLSVAGAASADTIQFRPGGAITSASLGRATFETEVSSVICPLTLRGRLRTEAVSNTAGTNIGEIAGVSTGECSGASGINILGLSWQLLLGAAFVGNVVSVHITHFEFEVLEAFGGLNCLYSGTANMSIATSSGVTGLLTSEGNNIPKGIISSIFCPSATRIHMTLGFTTQTIGRI